jgi:predicted amidohydrolase YtcJ
MKHFLPTLLVFLASTAFAAAPDLILHNGKVLTVDKDFSIRQAVAVTGDRITAVGTNDEILATKDASTKLIDLAGKMVLPGLIDSHTHPNGAAMIEADHPIPHMESIDDVLAYIKQRAAIVPPGDWIEVRQVFITRLKEQRYPTRAELDGAAPQHPVIFATGPDASVNTLAMKLSGIDRDFKVTDGGPGFIEKDKDGEPTGILRSSHRYVKVKSSAKPATEETRQTRLVELFRDYNSVGITSIADRSADRGAIPRYKKLLDDGRLTVRLSLSAHVDTIGEMAKIQQRIRDIAADPLCADHPFLRIVGIKTFLDGGMLTGSAYMRQPWGVSDTYAITDPNYRGVLFIPKDRLLPIVRTAVESKLQFTAHSVGDGAVHTLLETYAEIDKTLPVRPTRPCITHSNFMSKEAVEMLPRLGVVVDIQPAWLYLDTRTLTKQFGYDRLRYFQPLKSIFEAGGIAGGGSDHMQKIGSFRSVNPYNPFLGMQTAITRKARWYDGQLHPEEALSREQAIRFYTANNAYMIFREHQVGSLEPGKLADLIVLDTDLLTCPEDKIRDTKVLRTYLNGKMVYADQRIDP